MLTTLITPTSLTLSKESFRPLAVLRGAFCVPCKPERTEIFGAKGRFFRRFACKKKGGRVKYIVYVS